MAWYWWLLIILVLILILLGLGRASTRADEAVDRRRRPRLKTKETEEMDEHYQALRKKQAKEDQDKRL
jgi:hypothetical protein